MPAVFGQAMAAFVLCELAGQVGYLCVVLVGAFLMNERRRLDLSTCIWFLFSSPSPLSIHSYPYRPTHPHTSPQPILPVAVQGLSRAVTHKMLQHLRNRERRAHGNSGNEINTEDVEEVVQEVKGGGGGAGWVGLVGWLVRPVV